MCLLAASRSLWPEYEIINEDGGEYDVGMFADDGDQMDDSTDSLIDRLQGYSDMRSWGKFQECIAGVPEQVLRYCRSVRSRPLWPMSIGQPLAANIPHCSYCGEPRRFEFQVLPLLLHFFGMKNNAYSLDWATIAVYSCEASCGETVGYKEEFALVQV